MVELLIREISVSVIERRDAGVHEAIVRCTEIVRRCVPLPTASGGSRSIEATRALEVNAVARCPHPIQQRFQIQFAPTHIDGSGFDS